MFRAVVPSQRPEKKIKVPFVGSIIGGAVGMAVCGLISLSTTELASPGSHLLRQSMHIMYMMLTSFVAWMD